MRIKFTTLTALAVLAFPVAADAHPRHAVPGLGKAAHTCHAERQADVAAFKAKYANQRGRRAFARCVRAHLVQARTTCRTERQNDPQAFRTQYANERGRRAWPRCVREHADDAVA